MTGLRARHAAPAVVVAVLLHAGLAVALFWSTTSRGSIGAGQGGLSVSLSAGGGAPGLTAPLAPARTEAETNAPFTAEAVPTEVLAEVAPHDVVAADLGPEPIAATPPLPTDASVPDAVDVGGAPPSATTAPSAPPTPVDAIEPIRAVASVPAPSAQVETPPLVSTESPAAATVVEAQEPLSVESAPQQNATPVEVEASAAPTASPNAAPPRVVRDSEPTEVVVAAESATEAAPVPDAAAPTDVVEAQESAVDATETANAIASAAAPLPRRRPARPPSTAAPQRASAQASAPAAPRPEPQPDATDASGGDAAALAAETRGAGTEAAAGVAAGDGDAARNAQGGDPGAQQDWLAQVKALLQRHQRYPRRARARRQEGVGQLWLAVEAGGRITASRLAESTGHALLDREILAVPQRVGRLPPMPASMGRASMDLIVPMRFRLP